MNELTPIQARIIGCLLEKQETTPDQYPLTLNALKNACNQKTARNPVTAYNEGEIGHALRELESAGWVREAWGARAAKYEHLAGRVLGQHSKGLALLCVLMLRGPQTLGELKTHTQRIHAFDDLDDVEYALQRLAGHEPPLAAALPRQPGQKEIRYAHLLCGEPDLPPAPAAAAPPVSRAADDLADRVAALEDQVGALRRELEELKSRV